MNRVILTGRLTKDPELKTTASGVAVASFTLAVDRRFKSQNGEREADFITCRAWRQTAEFITKYFTKGAKLSIMGNLQTGKYEKDGRTIFTTDVIAEEAYFVESPNRNQQPNTYTPGTVPDKVEAPPYDDTALPFDL